MKTLKNLTMKVSKIQFFFFILLGTFIIGNTAKMGIFMLKGDYYLINPMKGDPSSDFQRGFKL